MTIDQNTIIEFAFNEKSEIENQNFYFKYVWKKRFKGWLKITICAILFLFLGFYQIENFDTSFLYYYFKYGGIFLAGLSIVWIISYFNSKKKFKKENSKTIEKFKFKNDLHFIILNETEIEFKNPATTIKSTWENTSYILSGDYILITPLNNLCFIVHKSEISQEKFKTILEYLKKNSKITK